MLYSTQYKNLFCSAVQTEYQLYESNIKQSAYYLDPCKSYSKACYSSFLSKQLYEREKSTEFLNYYSTRLATFLFSSSYFYLLIICLTITWPGLITSYSIAKISHRFFFLGYLNSVLPLHFFISFLLFLVLFPQASKTTFTDTAVNHLNYV